MSTPASRARARRDPAVSLPPKPPEGDRRSAKRNLHVRVAGVPYLIGPSIEGDPTMDATIEGTATLSIAVRDANGQLQEALADEAQLLDDGARVTVNGIVYVINGLQVDPETGTLVTLGLEDEVSWRLKQFYRFLAVRRGGSNTRARAFLRLVQEAGGRPYAPMRYWIPELNDKQRIAVAGSENTDNAKSGTGAATNYTVKGQRADSEQRQVINEALTEAKRLGASRRVMIAVVMCMTQESLCRRLNYGDAAGPDSRGPYQQRAAWGPEADRRDPAKSTRMFLTGGQGGQPGWKQKHGSLKTARGSLDALITAVQVSVGGYGQWEEEATRTVTAWRGSSGDATRVVEPSEFTRGTRDGERENSWDASGRWVQDVEVWRWAEANIAHYASGDELRAAAPALEVHGDEPWLLSPPGASWSPNRPNTEVTMRVLAERWGVRVGASVLVAGGTARGRYIVHSTSGYMVNPELAVVLRRPSTARIEPAATTRQAETSATRSGGSGAMLDACKKISGQGRPYDYGGGHGPKLSRINDTQGLDCSSSTSLALYLAGLFGDRKTAIVSGEFASSFGKPGEGQEFTIWANASHVWVEFRDGSRFDTGGPYDKSGQGSQRGPRYRDTKRNDQQRFTARHVPGH